MTSYGQLFAHCSKTKLKKIRTCFSINHCQLSLSSKTVKQAQPSSCLIEKSVQASQMSDVSQHRAQDKVLGDSLHCLHTCRPRPELEHTLIDQQTVVMNASLTYGTEESSPYVLYIWTARTLSATEKYKQCITFSMGHIVMSRKSHRFIRRMSRELS